MPRAGPAATDGCQRFHQRHRADRRQQDLPHRRRSRWPPCATCRCASTTNEFVAIIGPVGLGQVDPDAHPRLPRRADRRASSAWPATTSQAIDENQLADVRNRRIGFVFQQFNLLAVPAGLAQRRAAARLRRRAPRPSGERRGRWPRSTRSGLADRADHRPGELSGGQQQRVAVARALVTEPALILADEPTGNLDSTSTADVLDLFDELHAQGRTIVLITHEHDVAGTRSAPCDPRRPDRRDGSRMLDGATATERRPMTWRDTLRTAFDAVRTHRLRSALTDARHPDRHRRGRSSPSGSAQGAKAEVRDQINALGTNLLVVSPGSDDRQHRGPRRLRVGVHPDHRTTPRRSPTTPSRPTSQAVAAVSTTIGVAGRRRRPTGRPR